MNQFKKILIANRGEIALRIIKTARLLNIKTVTIYSDIEADALHAVSGDEAYSIGSGELKDSYLNINKIIDIALKTGSEAIHPGYGFLAENPLFVKACKDAGIIFIGPNEKPMRMMGNKIEARDFAQKNNIPMTAAVIGDIKQLKKAAKTIPYPLLIKAAAGGGGKGMRIVYNDKELENALETTSREALSYFSDGTIFIEKFIENPRHIEFQIIADNYGNVVHLFERECSLQRRYQKIVEESPSPTITPSIRKKMGETAVKIAKGIGYNNAGTIEFLVDKELNFYFLEMNTRIQVEHPVTEFVTGLDIVKEQLSVAAGNKLSLKQEDIRQNGSAIECRIYAEDPENNFFPSPGKMTFYKEPSGENVRLDSGIEIATTIHSSFDPMISKLIVWGENREIARAKMLNALSGYIIHGIRTDITYLYNLLQHDAYINNKISTKFCEENHEELLAQIQNSKSKIISNKSYVPLLSFLIYSLKFQFSILNSQFSIWNAIGYWRDMMNLTINLDDRDFLVTIIKKQNNTFQFSILNSQFSVTLKSFTDGKMHLLINNEEFITYLSSDSQGNTFISFNGFIFTAKRSDMLVKEDVFTGSGHTFHEDTKHIFSPMPGKVIKMNVKENEVIKKGDILVVVEAMKMENSILSPKDTVIEKINVTVGEMVDSTKPLIIFQS